MLPKVTILRIIFIVVALLVFVGFLAIASLLVMSNKKMVAVYESDFKKCNDLGSTDLIDDCILRIVRDVHDQKACDLVSDSFRKKKCLDTVNGHSLGHLMPCISVSIDLEKDICVKSVALDIPEPIFCDIIESPLVRETCHKEIKEKSGGL